MEYSYPKGEIVWVGHYDKDHNLRYITTSKPARDFYFLYELKDGKFVKLGKDKNPQALEKKFMVKNQICGDMNIAGIGAAQATVNGKVADSAKIGRNASTIAIIQDKTPDEIEADGAECGNKKLRIILNRNGAQMSQDEYIDLNFQGNLISYEEAKQHTIQMPY